jgi:adenylosuccinate synthase
VGRRTRHRKVLTEKGTDWLHRVEEQVGAKVSWLGTGPTLDDWCRA